MDDIQRKTSDFADRPHVGLYSWFDPNFLYFQQGLEKEILSLLKDRGILSLRGRKILDVGCGTGHWLRQFIKWGASENDCTGVDLLPSKIETAKRKSPFGVRVLCCDAGGLPFGNDNFDIAFQATVFTSILDDEVKEKAAKEMMRVVKSDGLILWYDFQFNNPNNERVKGVKKAEILRLFGGCEIQFRRVTLAPPVGRVVAPISFLLFQLLGSIPFLRSHLLASITVRNKAA